MTLYDLFLPLLKILTCLSIMLIYYFIQFPNSVLIALSVYVFI